MCLRWRGPCSPIPSRHLMEPTHQTHAIQANQRLEVGPLHPRAVHERRFLWTPTSSSSFNWSCVSKDGPLDPSGYLILLRLGRIRLEQVRRTRPSIGTLWVRRSTEYIPFFRHPTMSDVQQFPGSCSPLWGSRKSQTLNRLSLLVKTKPSSFPFCRSWSQLLLLCDVLSTSGLLSKSLKNTALHFRDTCFPPPFLSC